MADLPNPYHDPTKAHRRVEGFQNNYVEFQPRSLSELLRWQRQRLLQGLPPKPQAPTPRVEPELDWLHANGRAGPGMEPAICWIGHATVLAQLGGLTLLTDPVFSQRASPLRHFGPRRHSPPGIVLDRLPHVDLVLVSHNHYDHLDAGSVDTLNRQPGGPPLFVVPLGLKPWLAGRGIEHAVELDWWERHGLATAAGELEVTLVPAQHWSSRSPRDRMATLWGGFAVLAPDCHLLFTGDTAYSRDFTDIRRHFGPRQTPERGGGFDIALIPIGAYAPRWFMSNQHVDVAEALKIHADIAAKRSFGMHWGVFTLTDEPLDEPPRKLAELRQAQGLPEDAFFVTAIGETRRLARRPGASGAPTRPPEKSG
jgi:N-acyl-phosphatidylethanolamine-hydrolysing phospholipase D